jgi:hypothetical protein
VFIFLHTSRNSGAISKTRGGPSAWGMGVGLKTFAIKINLLRELLKSLGPGRILWINDPSYGIWI